MTPRYSALIQLVDYVKDPEHLAIGDLVCVEKKWRKVTKVDRCNSSDFAWVCAYAEGDDGFNDVLVNQTSIPRIPGVLLDLLQQAKDPYR